MKEENNIFDQATIHFFRIPEDACEYLDDGNNNDNNDDKHETASSTNSESSPPRARVLNLKKNLDALSLVACRRQGVLPSELTSSSTSKKLSWADKQHRLGLLRVLALERSRVATEIADVLEKEDDPQARLKMEQEIKLVQREMGSAGLVLLDPDEQEMVERLLSPHSSKATTAAIQERMINAVRRRSERAVARMYRSHERVIHNESENHRKRVQLVHHLKEREAVRDKMQAERKKELHEKVVQQSEVREKKMSALKIRFAVLNEAKKQELEEKIKHSEELYENAQQKQIEHLMDRSEKQHEKILTVQEQVNRARRDELDRRIQMDEERRQRDALHRERRGELLMKKDLRLEQRKRREELLQMKAKELRDEREKKMRKEFEVAHAEQLRISKKEEKERMLQQQRHPRASSSNSNNSRSRAIAYSRPSSKQQHGRDSNNNNEGAAAAVADDKNNKNNNNTPPPPGTPIDRNKAAREEMLRRQLLIQIQEEHDAKILEDRKIEAEAARRVRQREEQAKIEHNKENLRRKERADLHRQQLQQMLVEEQEKAAAQREKERLKAERKLQLLKLDLAKQREDAQERIREQEKKAHLAARENNDEDADTDQRADGGSRSPTPNKTTKAKEPPASSSSADNSNRRANPQNSSIMSVIAGGKKTSAAK